jgi:hypothetical protein
VRSAGSESRKNDDADLLVKKVDRIVQKTRVQKTVNICISDRQTTTARIALILTTVIN